MAADLHTHCPKGAEFELVSTVEAGGYTFQSLECHPWNLPDRFSDFNADFIAQAAKFSAIGEIGLDRLKGPELSVQIRYLDALLEIAESLAKPVVIHSVRCDSELFHALDGFSGNVLIHGFNSGAARLERYLEAGFMVSFSRLNNKDIIAFLKRNGLKNTGLETDVLDTSIDDIARNTASVLDIPLREVNANSLLTFKRMLSI